MTELPGDQEGEGSPREGRHAGGAGGPPGFPQRHRGLLTKAQVEKEGEKLVY